jgi:hypothetical protein
MMYALACQPGQAKGGFNNPAGSSSYFQIDHKAHFRID